MRDVVGRREPAQRDARRRLGAARFVHQRGDARREHRAGRHRVDTHAAGRELDRERPDECHQPGLGRAVRTVARRGPQPAHRRDRHDRTGAARCHVGAGRAREVEEVAEHEVERVVPGLVVEVDGVAVAGLADHIDDHVDRAVRAARRVERALHGVETARVAAARKTRVGQCGGRARRVGVEIEAAHARTRGRERTYARTPDAVPDAGDERVLPAQPEVEHQRAGSYDRPVERFSDRLAFFSARFSLSDLPGFLVLVFFGDLSATAFPPIEGDLTVTPPDAWR